MNMQFAAKLTKAALNDLRKDTRSKTNWRAIRLGAIPKLVFRGWAVVMALASIAARRQFIPRDRRNVRLGQPA